jgi:hypothetical protein
MECSSFRVAAGKTWEEKAKEACENCKKCNGNFPLDPSLEQEPDFISEVINDIREVFERDRAGCSFDLKNAGYIQGSLFLAFSKAVSEVENLGHIRMQAFLKSWMK